MGHIHYFNWSAGNLLFLLFKILKVFTCTPGCLVKLYGAHVVDK